MAGNGFKMNPAMPDPRKEEFASNPVRQKKRIRNAGTFLILSDYLKNLMR